MKPRDTFLKGGNFKKSNLDEATSNATKKQREIKIGTELTEMIKRWSLENFSLSSKERGREARFGRVSRGHEAVNAS